MNINKEFISKVNTYQEQNAPVYIVIHETDNWNNGAGARRHASAQAAGHLDMSVHYYSGSDGIYQAAEHCDGTYSIGQEYGGNHAVRDANNRNSINIEICVNADGDYNAARANAIELVKHLIWATGIPADRVIRHYDAKGKYCPRRMMDNPALWEDFKAQIGQPVKIDPVAPEEPETWYRVGSGWTNGVCQGQVGAYHNLEYAIAACHAGLNIYDGSGNIVYSGAGKPVEAFEVRVSCTDLRIRCGPGTNYDKVDTCPVGVFHIMETITADGYTWGRLKSGAGWIALEHTERL